jgi:pimeloyl-ACP methyl ester carboxylesterase
MSTRAAPDRYLELGGVRLHWQIEGSGPPIVLLHGWALDLHSWDSLVALLAPRFTVLRFDRRGFGLSGGAPDIHANVSDLLALLDAAGIDRPVLVGMSQGARLAIHFSLEHPQRTRALVLDGAPALEAESELPLARYRSLLESQGPAALQREVLRHPLMQLHGTAPAAARLLADVVARYGGQDLLHPPKSRRKPDLGAITAPVLILNGSDDSGERREAGRGLQIAIPGASHLMLQGAGHLAMLDNPAAYAQALDTFCATLPSP